MSGMFAPRISAASPLRVFVLRPAWPSAQPAIEWVRLSKRARASELARLFFDLPGLALGDERLEVRLLAGAAAVFCSTTALSNVGAGSS